MVPSVLLMSPGPGKRQGTFKEFYARGGATGGEEIEQAEQEE
ncbi:hypothetical protein ES708_06267 [subsurface metagenome]